MSTNGQIESLSLVVSICAVGTSVILPFILNYIQNRYLKRRVTQDYFINEVVSHKEKCNNFVDCLLSEEHSLSTREFKNKFQFIAIPISELMDILLQYYKISSTIERDFAKINTIVVEDAEYIAKYRHEEHFILSRKSERKIYTSVKALNKSFTQLILDINSSKPKKSTVHKR